MLRLNYIYIYVQNHFLILFKQEESSTLSPLPEVCIILLFLVVRCSEQSSWCCSWNLKNFSNLALMVSSGAIITGINLIFHISGSSFILWYFSSFLHSSFQTFLPFVGIAIYIANADFWFLFATTVSDWLDSTFLSFWMDIIFHDFLRNLSSSPWRV